MTKPGMSLDRSIARLLHALANDLFGAYRPELHYMRGPGPKWHEKHAPDSPPEANSLHRAEAA